MKPTSEPRPSSATLAIWGGGAVFVIAALLFLWKAWTLLPPVLSSEEGDPLKLWQHVHDASVHFPIALAIVAFLFDMGALVLRRPQWRPVGFWCLLIAALVSIPACLSGLTAQMGWFKVEKWGGDSLLNHRNLALIGSGMLLALSGWRIAAKDRLPVAAQWIHAYLVAGTVLVIGLTGYLGGYVRQQY